MGDKMKTIDLRSSLLSYVSRAHHKGAGYIEELLRRKGIKNLAYSHIRIIIILSVHKRLSMKEISELIGKDKSTVTSLVNKLEKLGYVRKNPSIDDKRVIYLELEEKSEEIVASVFQVAALFQEKVEGILTEEEMKTLLSLMEKLIKNF